MSRSLEKGILKGIQCFHYKFLDRSKFKAFADDEIKVIQMIKFLLGRAENIITSIFSFSHKFSKGFYCKVIKNLDCVVKRKHNFKLVASNQLPTTKF